MLQDNLSTERAEVRVPVFWYRQVSRLMNQMQKLLDAISYGRTDTQKNYVTASHRKKF